MLRKLAALLLCLSIPTAVVAMDVPENSYKVTYDGGSVLGAKAGDSTKLVIQEDTVLIKNGKNLTLATIPAKAVTEISYGQDVHRRIGAAIGIGVFTLGIGALMALTKSKKHFVGLTWADGEKKGGFAMQCDKGEYRGILAALEGITGKKAVDSTAMTVKN